MNLQPASAILDAGVRDGLWPGAVAAVGAGGNLERTWVLGSADTLTGRPMTVDTVFDLASLTKVMATLPVVLTLVDRGDLRLDAKLREFVPLVDGRVTVTHALTHTSGLPAHVRFSARTTAELIDAAAAVRVEVEPGTRVTYSDLGFVLLGGVVRAVTGDDLDVTAGREVFHPLGLNCRFRPPVSWRDRTAATEIYDGVATLGVVHDENAQTAGGVAGHAGLFGTLADVVGSLRPWFTPNPVLAEALHDRTAGLGGHRGLGWTCRGDGYDILSPGWGPRAVSHTGFTGTSMALDPDTGRWAVLLTNQVQLGRGRSEVFAARRRWHAALVGD